VPLKLGGYGRLKRVMDVAVSALLLVLLAPLLVIIAVVVKGTSKGPVFYRGVRTGLHNKPFKIWKFRTMTPGTEHQGSTSVADKDPRVTRVGRLLRRTKLDELPQLLNVLVGEMSLVGPRPEVPKYTDLYRGEELCILSVRPGITDYASIHYFQIGEVIGTEEVDRVYEGKVLRVKNRLRVKYVKEQGFHTDVKILAATFCSLLRLLWRAHS